MRLHDHSDNKMSRRICLLLIGHLYYNTTLLYIDTGACQGSLINRNMIEILYFNCHCEELD